MDTSIVSILGIRDLRTLTNLLYETFKKGRKFIDIADFRKTPLVGGVTDTSPATHSYLPAHKPANGADAQRALPAELLILNETSLPQLVVKSL